MKLTVKELVLYAILGAVMFVSNLVTFIPNTYTIGMLTVVYTLVLRTRALVPLYVYIFLEGVLAGFTPWWVPNLYIWAILWVAVMLLPKNMPEKAAIPVYCAVPAIHGLLFGVLYAPFQALMFGLGLEGTLAWVASGFPWDVAKAVTNIILGIFILPLSRLLKKII